MQKSIPFPSTDTNCYKMQLKSKYIIYTNNKNIRDPENKFNETSVNHTWKI